MNRIRVTMMSAAVGVAAIVAPASAQDARTAEVILAEMNALQAPEYDRSKRGDEDYQKGYMQERNAAAGHLHDVANVLVPHLAIISNNCTVGAPTSHLPAGPALKEERPGEKQIFRPGRRRPFRVF